MKALLLFVSLAKWTQYTLSRSLESSAGIATGWTIVRSEFHSWLGQDFSFLYFLQTGCGVHPTSFPVGRRDNFTGLKRPRREDNPSWNKVDVKKSGSIYLLPHTPLWRSAYAVKHKDEFTLNSLTLRSCMIHLMSFFHLRQLLQVAFCVQISLSRFSTHVLIVPALRSVCPFLFLFLAL
jgi:hypothetical protein